MSKEKQSLWKTKNREKLTEYNKKWRLENREKHLANKRDWYKRNLEKCKLSSKISREKHKEQRKIDYKKWADNHKDYLKEYNHNYQKAYYLSNKDGIDEKNKLYAQTHRQEMVKNVQKYVQNNIVKVKEYRKSFEQTISGKYRQLVHRAKHFSGTPLTLERFAILITQPCSYCGDNGKVGIDRIDNSQGYTTENSTPCCKICNFMKKTMTKEDFLKHITKIYLFNK